MWRPKKARVKKPHLWRQRRARRGELVPWDTSEHLWLEGRGDKLYLIAMIDDATSELTERFAQADSTAENLRLLGDYQEKIAEEKGLYWEYETPADFERELRNTLQNYLKQQHPLPPGVEPQPPGDSSTSTTFLRTYRTRLAHLFRRRRAPHP